MAVLVRYLLPALIAAEKAGLAVFGSSSLLQGRLTADLPEEIGPALAGAETDAQRALQFSRSAPGMTTALVGVSSPEHAGENFALARVPPADRAVDRRAALGRAALPDLRASYVVSGADDIG